MVKAKLQKDESESGRRVLVIQKSNGGYCISQIRGDEWGSISLTSIFAPINRYQTLKALCTVAASVVKVMMTTIYDAWTHAGTCVPLQV